MKAKLMRLASVSLLKLKKHSPEILVMVGIGSVISGTILACHATTKVKTITDAHKEVMDDIHEKAEAEELFDATTGDPQVYTPEEVKKDTVIVYTQTGWKLVKLYAPAVGLLSLGIVSLLGAHGIMRKRNAALLAAYNLAQESFTQYRGRVRDTWGDDADKAMLYGSRVEKIEVEEEDPETGKMKKVKKTATIVDPENLSQYARVFDESSQQWDKSHEYNRNFLVQSQNQFNNLLQTRGYVFLNEVYDQLGFPATPAGQVVGWLSSDHPDEGDGFIDFGIYDIYSESARDFINGYENRILLDFNVDGIIYDKLDDLATWIPATR